MAKVNAAIAKTRPADAPVAFTNYEHIPAMEEPAHYFSFFKLARKLDNPPVDLFVYQHVTKDIAVQSSTTGGMPLAKASQVCSLKTTVLWQEKLLH